MREIRHKIIKGIECKHCSKCGEWKPLSEFNKNKSKKDGLFCWCKECVKQHTKQYYQTHREGELERKKQYNAAHKEEKAAYNAKRYASIEGYAYMVRFTNLKKDREQGRCGKDEDILPPLEYYIWALQQPDFYDGKQYQFNEMGLDRIYNDKPHTFANVVPCSTKNNIRRQKMPFEEFRELIRKENKELELILE